MIKALAIAGSHRSGTSLTTQYLHSCGLFIGDDLLGAKESNRYGHFEDRDFIRIHDQILKANSFNWMLDRRIVPAIPAQTMRASENLVDLRMAKHGQWGFKDPRVCQFMHFWKALVPDLKTLVVYRHPVRCVNSLHRRHARDHVREPDRGRTPFYEQPDLALNIWTASNEALADYVECHPKDTLVVCLDTLRHGMDLSKVLSERWNLDLEPKDFLAIYDPAANNEGRNFARVAEVPSARAAMRTWQRLKELEERHAEETGVTPMPDDEPKLISGHNPDILLMENELLLFENAFLRERLEERTDLKKLQKDVTKLRKNLGDTRNYLEKVEEARESADARVSAMTGSTSWKVTAPVRRIMDMLRGNPTQ